MKTQLRRPWIAVWRCTGARTSFKGGHQSATHAAASFRTTAEIRRARNIRVTTSAHVLCVGRFKNLISHNSLSIHHARQRAAGGAQAVVIEGQQRYIGQYPAPSSGATQAEQDQRHVRDPDAILMTIEFLPPKRCTSSRYPSRSNALHMIRAQAGPPQADGSLLPAAFLNGCLPGRGHLLHQPAQVPHVGARGQAAEHSVGKVHYLASSVGRSPHICFSTPAALCCH